MTKKDEGLVQIGRLEERLKQHLADRRAMPEQVPDCTPSQRAVWRLQKAGIPDHMLEHLVGPDESPCLKAAREFVDSSSHRLLLLLGSVGVGKSVASAFACLSLVAKDLERSPTKSELVMFAHATTFARMSSYDKSDRAWFESLLACRTLFIDDLGTEHLGDVGKSLFNEMFEERCARGKTVFTSNLSLSKFEARYGDRTLDRIRQLGIAFVDDGQSRRRQR